MENDKINPLQTNEGPTCAYNNIGWIFIASSVVTYLVFLASILIYRGFLLILIRRTRLFLHSRSKNIIKRKRLISTKKQKKGQDWKDKVNDLLIELTIGQSMFGKFVKCLIFLVSTISVFIYMIDAKPSVVEMCNVWENYITFKIQFILNMILTLHFMLRYVAAYDRLWFLFELHTFIDMCILPPFFLALYLNHNWIGFQSFRAFRILSLPNILVDFNIIKKDTSVRLAQLCCTFFAVWIAAAGIVHLIENSGDPPSYDNKHPLSYYICFYYVLITMSTVGYGDYTATTVCGKAFIMIFILIGLALFASCIPEIIELIGSKPKYTGVLQLDRSRKYIILCGHVTHQSVLNVIRDFIHEDREDEVHIVILNQAEPDVALENLIKRNHPMVLYFQGSMTNYFDLERVKLQQADACLILADKYTLDPDAEDATNIMRVISIKNYITDIKVLVQLILYRNKAYILNIPSFDRLKGDHVICLSEFKLGLFAQSCVAPGFSTMLANLVAIRSFKKSLVKKKWSYPYLRGVAMSLYSEMFSRSFSGMSFNDAVLLCYSKLKLILVAIENRNSEGIVKVNPKNEVIYEFTTGFFIAQSSIEAKRAWYYCRYCHVDVKDETLIKKCNCRFEWAHDMDSDITIIPDLDVEASKATRQNRLKFKRKLTYTEPPNVGGQSSAVSIYINSAKYIEDKAKKEPKEMGFDSTGMFHWIEAKPFDELILDRHSDNIPLFKGHIIICIFADANSPIYGLRNFILPLRTSNFLYCELKDIIIIGCIEYLRREWLWFQNLPRIFLLNGSPLNRADLKAVKIQFCDMCCIVSAKNVGNTDVVLNDKEAILATLNIKSMKYDTVRSNAGLFQNSVESLESSYQQQSDSIITINSPVLTEIHNDSNVVFLDEEEDDPDIELYLSQPFACGTVFAISVLDVLLSMTYFNHKTIRIIRTLLNNGGTRELEQFAAEGHEFKKGDNSVEILQKRDRCRLDQISLSSTPLIKYKDFGTLFNGALKHYDMICLGLYRYCALDSVDSVNEKRYVITNPPSNFILDPTDKVFVLVQFNTDFDKITKRMSKY